VRTTFNITKFRLLIELTRASIVFVTDTAMLTARRITKHVCEIPTRLLPTEALNTGGVYKFCDFLSLSRVSQMFSSVKNSPVKFMLVDAVSSDQQHRKNVSLCEIAGCGGDYTWRE